MANPHGIVVQIPEMPSGSVPDLRTPALGSPHPSLCLPLSGLTSTGAKTQRCTWTDLLQGYGESPHSFTPRPRRATKGHARRRRPAMQCRVMRGRKRSQNDSQRHRRQPSASLRQYMETPREKRGPYAAAGSGSPKVTMENGMQVPHKTKSSASLRPCNPAAGPIS